MTAFSYPKSKHTRTQDPGQLGSYQAYKPILRVEFQRACVYCRMPDTLTPDAFGVDHYRPQQRFPALRTSYANLFYACNPCNSRKGSHWPLGRNAADQMIPNPCDQVMVKHLRFKGEVVQAQSTAGQFTVDLLDLNRPASLTTRRTMIHSLELAETRRQECLGLLSKIQKEIKKGLLDSHTGEDAIRSLRSELARLDATVQSLGGA